MNDRAPPTHIVELASLQRYTAMPEGWRQVTEDQHIADSSYPHPAPMVPWVNPIFLRGQSNRPGLRNG